MRVLADTNILLRLLNPADLRPELAGALKGLHTGEYSGVVAIPSGFAVLTILSPRKSTSQFNPDRLHDLIASGVVRYGIDVSGDTEENAVFNEYPKPPGWEHDLREVCKIRKESHAAAVQRMSAMLAHAETDSSGRITPIDLMQGHGALSQLHAFVGDMDQSIAQAKAAYDIAVRSAPDAVPYLSETLGALYLHKAEMENGVYRNPGESDLFPAVATRKPYAKQDDSRNAIAYFTKYLQAKPGDVGVEWLLNLAYMTVGEYPAKVPAKRSPMPLKDILPLTERRPAVWVHTLQRCGRRRGSQCLLRSWWRHRRRLRQRWAARRRDL